jgi:hypothetical protein
MPMSAAARAAWAFGPSLPVSTASTPLSLMVWAAAMPAPLLALTDVLAIAIACASAESVSTRTNHGALPKAESVSADKSFPAAVIQSFIVPPP